MVYVSLCSKEKLIILEPMFIQCGQKILKRTWLDLFLVIGIPAKDQQCRLGNVLIINIHN